MKYEILTINTFDKQFKRLIKKYPSLKNEMKEVGEILTQNPTIGIPLGNNCYKIRISISSKGKGKSGGGRVITYVLIRKETVFLLSIYDKSEQDNISDSDIQKLLEKIPDKSL